jgi:hypothetical protein
MRDYSCEKVRVLMRLEASKTDLGKRNVHRTDRDFAVTWVKTYGKGRVSVTRVILGALEVIQSYVVTRIRILPERTALLVMTELAVRPFDIVQ